MRESRLCAAPYDRNGGVHVQGGGQDEGYEVSGVDDNAAPGDHQDDLRETDPLGAKWRVKVGERIYGPYSGHQIRRYVGEGRIVPESVVKPVDGGRWRQAGTDALLRDLFTAPWTGDDAPASEDDAGSQENTGTQEDRGTPSTALRGDSANSENPDQAEADSRKTTRRKRGRKKKAAAIEQAPSVSDDPRTAEAEPSTEDDGADTAQATAVETPAVETQSRAEKATKGKGRKARRGKATSDDPAAPSDEPSKAACDGSGADLAPMGPFDDISIPDLGMPDVKDVSEREAAKPKRKSRKSSRKGKKAKADAVQTDEQAPAPAATEPALMQTGLGQSDNEPGDFDIPDMTPTDGPARNQDPSGSARTDIIQPTPSNWKPARKQSGHQTDQPAGNRTGQREERAHTDMVWTQSGFADEPDSAPIPQSRHGSQSGHGSRPRRESGTESAQPAVPGALLRSTDTSRSEPRVTRPHPAAVSPYTDDGTAGSIPQPDFPSAKGPQSIWDMPEPEAVEEQPRPRPAQAASKPAAKEARQKGPSGQSPLPAPTKPAPTTSTPAPQVPALSKGTGQGPVPGVQDITVLALRQLLQEPDVKDMARSAYLDETGQRDSAAVETRPQETLLVTCRNMDGHTQNLAAAIGGLGETVSINPTCWMVRTDHTPDRVRDCLAPYVGDLGGIFVMDSRSGASAWHNLEPEQDVQLRDLVSKVV